MINHCDDGRAKGRALLLAPALLTLAVAGFGQNPELLPTVNLRPAASAPAQTTDCATGLAAAAPRLEIEPARPPEMPRAVERATAASRDTSTLLRRVQDAAEANDRTAFKATLESARAGVRNLDSGAQRTRADEILKVYDDIQRVWDYSFATPTGSFFSAESQGGTLLAAMSRYPGYTDFIRKQSLLDQEHERFYPTRETRAFLTTQAEQMLRGARLGTVAGTKTRVAGSEQSRSSSAPQKSLQGGRSSSSDRKAHHPSTGTKSRSSSARPRAPKSHTTAGERSGSSSTPTPTPKRGLGRSSNRTRAETPHPTTAASAGMPRSAGRRPQSEPTPASSPTTRNPVRGSTSIPAAALRKEPQKQPAQPSPAAVTTSVPLPGSTAASSVTTSASGSSSAPTTAPSGKSTMSASGTSSTTSSISSSTSGGETTGAAETTTSAGTPTQRTSEPPVPSGGRTYLSILMVVIGLIVLIVLIRASK